MNIINTHLLNKTHQKSLVLYSYIHNYRAIIIKQLIVSFNKLLESFMISYSWLMIGIDSSLYHLISKKKLKAGGRPHYLKFGGLR